MKSVRKGQHKPSCSSTVTQHYMQMLHLMLAIQLLKCLQERKPSRDEEIITEVSSIVTNVAFSDLKKIFY